MKRSISPARSLLAVALAMAAVPVLAQDGPYTQTVFFGDSLTDAGYFRPLLPASVVVAVPRVGVAAAAPVPGADAVSPAT